jgi:hypothetical protein
LSSGGAFLFSERPLPEDHARTMNVPHQTYRSVERITALLDDNGFDLVRVVPMFVLMETPVAIRNAFVRTLWKLAVMAPSRIPGVSWMLGALLYPVEVVLTRILSSGPSNQIYVCSKRS